MAKKEKTVVKISDFRKAAKAALAEAVDNGNDVEILKAELKDDFCFYTYRYKGGIHAGFKQSVIEAPGIVSDELRKAFEKMNVHLAVIDDVFKHAGVIIDDIDQHHNDELAQLYIVSTMDIRGGDENESVILSGIKILSDSSRMKLTAPKKAIDDLSSYKWHNELAAAVAEARHEVKLYHYGNFTPVEQEEKEDPKQTKLQIVAPNGEVTDNTPEVNFEEGKV